MKLLGLSILLLSTLTASALVFDKSTNTAHQDQAIPKGIKKLIVVNFYVPQGTVQEKQGILQKKGPLRQALSGGDNSANEEVVKAQKASKLLARTLTEKLNDNDALKAAKIFAEYDDLPDEPTSSDTLVVDGSFLLIDEGGRLLQTGIGFGAGASKVEIETELLDYSKAPPVQIMQIGSHSNPRRGPGAILMMNPYVAAAKFVMSKNATDKDIKKIAGGLAQEIAKYLTGQGQ
jgi:hypothetical protein